MTEESRHNREQELIEAGKRHELIMVVRETVRQSVRSEFRRHYGDMTPEEIRDQHTRVRHWLHRWDKWMERFWYSFAMLAGWLFFAAFILNWLSGNPIIEGLLKKGTP